MQYKNYSQIQFLTFLIFLTLSRLSILQKNSRFFLASSCLLNFLLNSFPKKIFQISSPSPCDNLTKNRWFQSKFEFSLISNLYIFWETSTLDEGRRLLVWNCRQEGHQEVNLSATSDYGWGLLFVGFTFEFLLISHLYDFWETSILDQGNRLLVWNCRQAGHQEATLSATSDYRWGLLFVGFTTELGHEML